ncbi:SAM-dependent methyltransferase [Agromyces sp. SYSU T00194]|uniref:SAM-dependent methyltransferase n=1 Tax=Agromyces chitinivorans TaxID=3158560 RepID=UPI00339B1E8D
MQVEPRFGAGGAEPYDRALGGGSAALELAHLDAAGRPATTPIDVGRFSAPADEADRSTLDAVHGPVLDAGCGPGRMVLAAILAGHLALGVDVSAAAVAIARARGLPVLRRSVFDRLPSEGGWGAVLLLDGNVGIGGSPAALLARCAALVAARGRVVVETHVDHDADHAFEGVLHDASGGRSLPFPWAHLGVRALPVPAAAAGLRVRDAWTVGDRSFAALEPA